jgi:hypothetical protein
MLGYKAMNRLGWLVLLSSGVMLAALPVLSGEKSNFGTLTLGADKPSGSISGSTGGSTSLPAIVSNSDRNGNKCLGFGDPTPDHILILQQDFPSLKLRVNTGGTDTTLVIQGPDGVVRCGDDISTSNKDALVNDTDWRAGLYKVWVGTSTPGVRREYTLNVRQ